MLEPIEKTVWLCPYCKRQYSSRPGVLRHITCCYANPAMRACPSCGRRDPLPALDYDAIPYQPPCDECKPPYCAICGAPVERQIVYDDEGEPVGEEPIQTCDCVDVDLDKNVAWKLRPHCPHWRPSKA